jgi:hypothetical protein
MKVLKRGREERINERLRKLSSRRGYRYFITHVGYPSQKKESDIFEINKYSIKVEEAIPQIRSLLKEYRKHIPHIWDQTKFCASYLLICKAFSNLKTLILLARNGSNQELVEISRSAVESLDLTFLFLEDTGKKPLKDWFAGKIIGNQEARKAMHDAVNKEDGDKTIVPLEDVKSDVYETYSLYTHSSYAALLDSIDVFYEDYDFKKYAGFHYTAKNLHLIDNIVINILLGLKSAFIQVRDLKNFEATDSLMKAIGYRDLPRSFVDETLKDYKS